MRKSALLISVMIFLALATPAFAFQKGTASSNVNYEIAKPITLADGSVIQYTPYCFVDCYLPINISYSGMLETATKSLRNSDINLAKEKVIGQDRLQSIDYYYVSNESYIESVWKSNVTCQNITVNSTVEQSCTDKGTALNITKWGNFLRPIVSKTMQKDTPDVIVLKGKMKASIGVSAIDIVPTVFGFQMAELAWWNTSWTYVRGITINNTLNGTAQTNYAFFINITNSTGFNVDFSDLRFTNSSNVTELPYWIERKVNSSFAEVWVKVDSISTTTTKIFMWYNNSVASASATNLSTVFLFGDDFNRADSVGLGNGWTNSAVIGNVSNNMALILGNGGWGSNQHSFASTSAPIAYEWKWMSTGTDNWGARVCSWPNCIADAYGYGVASTPSSTDYLTTMNISSMAVINIVSFAGGAWYKMKMLAFNSSNMFIQINGTQYSNNVSYGDANNKHGTFNNVSIHSLSNTYNHYIDDLFVRSYVLPEPTYSIGAEESGGTPTSIALYLNSTQGNITQVYGASVNATAVINISGIPVNVSRNGTVIATGTTRAENTSLLPAGFWNYTGFFNGNATYIASSTTWYVNVSKATPNCTLSVMPSTPTYYGNQTNATCTCTNPEIYANLYRNNTNVSSENNTNILLGGGAYSYVCNITSTQNYTAANASANYVVNKATPALNITFNSTNPVVQGSIVNVSCNKPAQITANLYNNTSSISNPYIFNTTGLLGNYNFICNTTGNANYTAANTSNTLTITASGGISISVFDEENPSNALTFNITINNGTFSNTAYDQSNPYVNSSITGLITIDISGADYPQREYYISVSPSSAVNLTAYLLASASGSWCQFYVYSPFEQPIPGALINVERLIPPSSYLTVAQKEVDTSGSASIFLSPITTYRFNLSAVNYQNKSFSLQPGACPYVIYMNTSSAISFNSSFKGIYWQIIPEGAGLLNNTTAFNFTITAGDGDLNFYGMNITLGNGTSLYFNNSTSASGGSMQTSINLGPYNGSTVFLNGFFKKSGWGTYTFQRIYYVYDTVVPGNSSLVGTADFLKGTGQMSQFVWGIISIFMTLIVMGLASKEFSYSGSGLLGLAAMAVMTYLGTRIFGAGYWLGWNMLFGIGIAVVGMLYLRSNT